VGTGRSAAANVVALASKLFRDVSISGGCAIPIERRATPSESFTRGPPQGLPRPGCVLFLDPLRRTYCSSALWTSHRRLSSLCLVLTTHHSLAQDSVARLYCLFWLLHTVYISSRAFAQRLGHFFTMDQPSTSGQAEPGADDDPWPCTGFRRKILWS